MDDTATARQPEEAPSEETTHLDMPKMPQNLSTFTLFPNLPPELRDRIWEECIPGRLVLADWTSPCCEKQAVLSQRALPYISTVCREARAVVLRTGAWVTTAHGARNTRVHHEWGPEEKKALQALSHGDRTWFNARKDTMLFSQFESDGRIRIPDPNYPNDPKRSRLGGVEVLSEAIQRIRASGRAAFTSFEPARYPSFDMLRSELAVDSLSCVIDKLYIHIPLPVAVDSGLFGLFGEEKVVALDPADKSTFRKLVAAQERCSSARATCDGSVYLPDIVHSDLTAQEIHDACQGLIRFRFLLEVYYKDNHGTGDGCKWHRKQMDPDLTGVDPVFDPKHPYVQELLATLPAIKPVILCVLCSDQTHFGREPSSYTAPNTLIVDNGIGYPWIDTIDEIYWFSLINSKMSLVERRPRDSEGEA